MLKTAFIGGRLKELPRLENGGMAKGRKTGGRAPGVPNRRTVEITARLEQLGCDPIEGMARIAMDLANTPELRGRMYAELAQYVAPKRRALDVDAHQSAPVSIRIGIPVKRMRGESEAAAHSGTAGPAAPT